MFSCCFKATPGSEPKKDKSEGRGGVWKHRVHSCLQCLWPFGGKETNLTQGSHVQDHKDQVISEIAEFHQNLLWVFGCVMVQENLNDNNQ